MFLCRELTLAQQQRALKKAGAYIKEQGIESEEEQKNARTVHLLQAATFRAPAEGDVSTDTIPLFQTAEFMLQNCTKTEMAVLNRCYQETVRLHSPAHTRPITEDDLQTIIAAIHSGESLDTAETPAYAAMLVQFTEAQLVELLIRVALKIPSPITKLMGTAVELDAGQG